MFANVFQQVTGQLDRRFVLGALFPTLVFALLAGLVAVSVSVGVDGAVEWWEERASIVQILLVVGAVAAIFVVANLIASNMTWVVQLFEGYAFPVSLLAAPARRQQLHTAQRLELAMRSDSEAVRARASEQRWQRYPWPIGELTEATVAPTRLGNLLRNAETYPHARYGVDGVRLWPLLYHCLPEGLRTSMSDARASMEGLLVIALWAAVLAPSASVALLVDRAAPGWVLATLLGGTLVAVSAYAGALAPATLYGEHVRAAFDLHRFELLASLRMPIPATLAEERRVWERLTPFLTGDLEHNWRYVTQAT